MAPSPSRSRSPVAFAAETAKSALNVVGQTSQELTSGMVPGLSAPAAMMLVAYCIMAVIIILPLEMPVYDEQTGEYTVVEYNFGHRLLMLLFLAVPVIASVYSVQCMMAGQCTIWSYVVSLVHIFWVAVFVMVALIYAFRGKKQQPPAQAQAPPRQ